VPSHAALSPKPLQTLKARGAFKVFLNRHCEKRSDEPIHDLQLIWIASLSHAMTIHDI
jgi:hypothetical protein